MRITDQEFARLREKVELLTGERGDRSRAALTSAEAQEMRRTIAQLATDIATIKAHLGL